MQISFYFVVIRLMIPSSGSQSYYLKESYRFSRDRESRTRGRSPLATCVEPRPCMVTRQFDCYIVYNNSSNNKDLFLTNRAILLAVYVYNLQLTGLLIFTQDDWIVTITQLVALFYKDYHFDEMKKLLEAYPPTFESIDENSQEINNTSPLVTLTHFICKLLVGNDSTDSFSLLQHSPSKSLQFLSLSSNFTNLRGKLNSYTYK